MEIKPRDFVVEFIANFERDHPGFRPNFDLSPDDTDCPNNSGHAWMPVRNSDNPTEQEAYVRLKWFDVVCQTSKQVQCPDCDKFKMFVPREVSDSGNAVR